ncbi:MAG: MBL fold metallo-hydrolase [Dehalococcoidales bacterium]
MKLTKHAFQFSGIWGTGVWGANVYLLIDDNLTLVDTGFKGRCGQILKEVRRLGYSPSDISNIIITHHHADHIGSLAVLKEITRAKVLAHAADAPYIDGRLPQPTPGWLKWLSKALPTSSQLWSTNPVPVDMLVNDGDELPILGGITILHTPGHTQGSISLFLQEKRLLIAGDVLANRFRLGLPSKEFTMDMAQEINSIKRIASLDFDVIGFGHGSPIRHEAHSKIEKLVETLESKHQRIR